MKCRVCMGSGNQAAIQDYIACRLCGGSGKIGVLAFLKWLIKGAPYIDKAASREVRDATRFIATWNALAKP